jgi:hypothetical protein
MRVIVRVSFENSCFQVTRSRGEAIHEPKYFSMVNVKQKLGEENHIKRRKNRKT